MHGSAYFLNLLRTSDKWKVKHGEDIHIKILCFHRSIDVKFEELLNPKSFVSKQNV